MLTKHLTGRFRSRPASRDADSKVRQLGAAIKERDTAIKRLEEKATEHKTHVAKLKAALKRAKFKRGVLEQSYSTQLGEARERAAVAERMINDQQTRLGDLEAEHKALKQELSAAQARLATLGGSDSASIDELLAGCSMPQDQAAPREAERKVDAPTDRQTLEEMLAPDVMFAGKSEEAV